MADIPLSQNSIFQLKDGEFEPAALRIFRFQARHNPVYRRFTGYLKIDPDKVNILEDIPFLPIELFKTQRIITGDRTPEKVFESSGTTGQQTSRHWVVDLSWYHRSIESGFRLFFGDPAKYRFLALLPSYLERENASLVYMMQYLMQLSPGNKHGFFIRDFEGLARQLQEQAGNHTRFLIGVSFALLDFAETYPLKLENTIVIETGGMKGRREEITRQALHEKLSRAFGIRHIYSEYGMTELLSQAWMLESGRFRCPPWMRVLISDPYNPMRILPPGQRGAINVIDLANVYSCCFIATEDTGMLYPDGSFEVYGRLDAADIRGCNLMY